MKETTFFILVGALSAVSLVSGLIGWRLTKRLEYKKHGNPSTFREVYEDNESDDLGDLYEDSCSL